MKTFIDHSNFLIMNRPYSVETDFMPVKQNFSEQASQILEFQKEIAELQRQLDAAIAEAKKLPGCLCRLKS